MSRPKGGKERPTIRATAFDFERFDTFLIWTYPQVGNLPLRSLRVRCETSATYYVSTRTERVLLFRARDANSRIRAVQGSTMEPERGDSKSERLRKRKAVTPHRPAKRPRLFQADQQETELRQRHTFRKWRHNLAVCVNRAKSA